jgi:excisionase family DNA binding protein
MKIYKITEASEYLGVSINTLKTLANNEKIKSFKTTGEHRRFRQEDLDAYMGVEKENKDALIEQMREALRLANDLIDDYVAVCEHPDNVDEVRDIIKAALSAALSAAERGGK